MSEPLRQRTPRVRDKAHLAFVGQQPCCICGAPPRSAAAHIRMGDERHGKRDTGMQEKPSDRWVVPLCDPTYSPGKGRWCHQGSKDSQHAGNERAFWDRVGLDPCAIATTLWAASGGQDRVDATETRRTRRPPAKPMKRKAPQAKARNKRAWPKRAFPQGRGFR